MQFWKWKQQVIREEMIALRECMGHEVGFACTLYEEKQALPAVSPFQWTAGRET